MAYKVNTLFTVTYDNLKNAITNIKSQFKSVEQSAESVKKKVSNTFSTANRDIKEVNSAIKESSNLIDSGLKASALGVATITTPVLLAGKSALKLAGQYEASVQTIEYTLGEAKNIVDDFVEHNAQRIGMAEQDAYKFANIYSNLLTTMTNDQKTNAEYTNKLMQASAVIMSKTGRTFTDVADRIRSGLLGNTEAIEDLGVNVNVALLETTDAFNQIADVRSWEKLSFQEQQQVRLLGILEQTSKKYGEEVGNNLSLKLAQTSAQYENLKSEASQFLAIGLQPMISGINNALSGIMVFVKYLNSLDDGTKQTITTFIVIVAIIPVVALAFFTLIKAINSYVIFTKVASSSTVGLAKSMIGLLGTVMLLVAGIAMIAYSLGVFNNSSKNMNKTAKNTSTASKALDGLSASQNNNAKSADKASKANKELADNLQGFDEINKLNIDNNTGSGNLDSSISPNVDLSGIDLGAFDDIDGQFDNLNEKVDGFKNKLEELKPIIGIVGGVLTGLGIFKIAKGIYNAVTGTGLLASAFKALVPTVSASARAGSAMVVDWGALCGTLSTATSLIVGVALPIATLVYGIKKVNESVYECTGATDIFSNSFLGVFTHADKRISDTTKSALEPFIEKIKELNNTIYTIDLKHGIVSPEDVENVKTQTANITNELKNGLIDKMKPLQDQINNTKLVPDPAKQKEYLDLINKELKYSITDVETYQNEINSIVETASNERRELTDSEKYLINNNIKAMGEESINILSENEQEKLLLQSKFNDKYYALSTEQVVETVAKAKELKDKTIAEAEAEYDERVKLAETMKATVPGFTEEMYDEMITSAQDAKDKQIKEANDTYTGITDKVKEKYPEVADTIDFENGRALTAWEAFNVNLGKKIDNIKDKISNKFNQIKEGIEAKMTEIKGKIEYTVKSIVTWLKNNFKFPELKAPNIPHIKTPHFTVSYNSEGFGSKVFQAMGMEGTPSVGVQWYKNGGIFTGASVIGVGEYPNAKLNPEIVTPQNLMYDTVVQANRDSQSNNYNNISSENSTIKKKIELEIDMTSGGVRLGKKIIDLILDANDFYDLDLI